MFKPNLRRYAKKALEERGVEVLLGDVVASITPTRVTLEVGVGPRGPHPRLGRRAAGEPALRAPSASSSRREVASASSRASALPEHPEVFAVGDIAWITDAKTKHPLPQLGSVALQSGEHAGETIARLVAGKKVEPFAYRDKGTMATIGRGAAVIQLPHGRTIKGKTASLAWGSVHLALLSTGEDRAKAMLDWTWAGFTHERAGRITVRADEE